LDAWPASSAMCPLVGEMGGAGCCDCLCQAPQKYRTMQTYNKQHNRTASTPCLTFESVPKLWPLCSALGAGRHRSRSLRCLPRHQPHPSGPGSSVRNQTEIDFLFPDACLTVDVEPAHGSFDRNAPAPLDVTTSCRSSRMRVPASGGHATVAGGAKWLWWWVGRQCATSRIR